MINTVVIICVILLVSSILNYLSSRKYNKSVKAMDLLILKFSDETSKHLNNIKNLNKTLSNDINKITSIISATGDIRKSVIIIASFKSKLIELSNLITKFTKTYTKG
jgi:hypothetical protein